MAGVSPWRAMALRRPSPTRVTVHLLLLAQSNVPVDTQPATFQIIVIEPVIGLFCISPILKFNKSVAFTLASPFVDTNGNTLQRSATVEGISEVPLSEVVREIANEQRTGILALSLRPYVLVCSAAMARFGGMAATTSTPRTGGTRA